MNFAQRLREIRKRLKLTQAECARLLETSPRSVWAWEKGHGPDTLKQEAVIRRLLDFEASQAAKK